MPEIDWTKSMQQTFQFYEVNPVTWLDKRPIKTIKSCEIVRDEDNDTLGYAQITGDDIDREMYLRTYMIAIQNGNEFKIPMGTHLIQSPSNEYDGKEKSSSIDAYTPLIELKENHPPIGYSLLYDANIMSNASRLTSENLRAPVEEIKNDDKKITNKSGFVANTDDTWLTFLTDLIGNADYEYATNPMGNILFQPKQDVSALQPVWTYTDDNSSILYPKITMDRDLYSIPNVVEVVYSTTTDHYVATAINDDPNSPISTVNRGRRITHRVTNPEIMSRSTREQLDEYARMTLKSLSVLEYTLTYTHGYCPVTVGDCVRLNYTRAGIIDVKAKVKRQTIKCESGCSVSETAVFTTNLWG